MVESGARLKIAEIFVSLQGEGAHSGWPCTFVRLTGCALRCAYCDTAYAFHGGSWYSLEDVVAEVERRPPRLVQITGGEPLHQQAVWPLVDRLIQLDYRVLIETSGAVSIAGLNEAAHIVLDIKTPGSAMSEHMLLGNLDLLKASDEVKLVVCDRGDWLWCERLIREQRLHQRCQVLVSPVASMANKAECAEWVLASGLPLRFQVQLHKILWGDEPGK
jgi:7-carboxy-7-deazaguanine synthase